MATISKNFLNFLPRFSRSLCFHSKISLKNLYPNSSLKITTPSQPKSAVSGKFSGIIPIDKLDITYSRSSGPGGQHVNTVNTKVDIRFHVESADWLDPEIRKKLIEDNKTKLSKDGYLIIRSDLTRSQHLNLADALEKLRVLIRETLKPKPELSVETEAMIQKRLMKTNRERLLIKRERSQTKKDRQAPDVHSV